MVTFGDLKWFFMQLIWNLVVWYILCIHIWPNKKIDLWWPLVFFGYLWWPLVSFGDMSTNQCEHLYFGLYDAYIPDQKINWPLVTFGDLLLIFSQLMWNLICRYIICIHIWPKDIFDLWWPLITFDVVSTSWYEIWFVGLS